MTTLNLFDLEKLHLFFEMLKQNQIVFINQNFDDIISKYDFFIINDNSIKEENFIKIINNNLKNSNVMIVGQNKQLNQDLKDIYLIISIEKTLIIIKKSKISMKFLASILFCNSQLSVCFLSGT